MLSVVMIWFSRLYSFADSKIKASSITRGSMLFFPVLLVVTFGRLLLVLN